MVMQSYTSQRRKPFHSTTMVYENYWRSKIKNQFSSDSHSIAEQISFNVSAATNGNYKSPTRHSFQKTTARAHVGSMFESAYYGPDWFDTSSNGAFELCAGSTFPTDMITQVQNRTYSELMEKVRGQIDLSVDVFQSRQTKQMVTDATNFLTEMLKQDSRWLKREFLRFVRSPRRIGSKWLEFQYGWKPTAQTLYEAGRKIMEQSNELIRVTARASEFRSRQEISRTSSTFTQRFIEHSARSLRVVNLKLSNSALQTLAGYTSLNPASIAWELTPFSFVADWFIDFGGYLRNLESAIVYSTAFHSGFTTVTTKTSINSIITEEYADPYYRKLGSRTGSWEEVTKDRSPMYSMPLPSLPSFNVNMGTNRLLNAAALLSQHLR